MKRPVLISSLLAMLLSPLMHVSDADAQRGARDRDRSPRQAQQQQPAEVRYPDATREDPSPQTNERTYRQIARAFDDINAENHDRARSALESLQGNTRLTDYERALVYQGLAQLAYEDDNVDDAIRYWNQAVELDSLPNNDHYQLMYQVAQLQMSEERYAEATRTLARWRSETRSTNPEAIALEGNLLYRTERYDEAIQLLEQAIRASDNPSVTLFELKMASHYENDDYPGAAQTLEQLVRREPDEVKHQINLAQTYLQMDQNDKALQVLARAQERNLLTDASHMRQLYQLLSFAEQHDQAIQVMRDGMAQGKLPEDATNLRALGDNLYMAERMDEAIDAYTRAGKLSTDGNADQQAAHLLNESDRFAESKQALQAAFQKGGLNDPGTAYLLLGQAELELGNQAAAKAAFEQALNHDNSRSNAQIWLRNF